VLDASGLAAKALEEVALEPLDVLRDWALAIIHAEHGRRAESDEALRRLTQDNAADCAYQIAVVHAVRGEFVLTREWLERAYAQRDGGLLEVNVSPGLELFRADPLGREFLRKMKFIET
jgi:hypothetical protein